MRSSERVSEHRAAPPQVPALTRGLEQARERFEAYRREREKAERRSVLRALILIAIVVLVGSVLHAGMDRVFVQGWWRP
jgi:ferric-dicitrate binding protein FerR (iron transport regulator)